MTSNWTLLPAVTVTNESLLQYILIYLWVRIKFQKPKNWHRRKPMVGLASRILGKRRETDRGFLIMRIENIFTFNIYLWIRAIIIHFFLVITWRNAAIQVILSTSNQLDGNSKVYFIIKHKKGWDTTYIKHIKSSHNLFISNSLYLVHYIFYL